MRLQDIALRTGLPTATALRMINTMQTLGYVHQNADTLRYSLTLKFAHIGNCVSGQVSVRDIARPLLLQLSKTCGESVCLTQERDMEVLYLDIVDGPDNMLKITQYIGKRAPMHCTGAGKLFLLSYSDEKLRDMIEQKGMKQLTVNTITDYDSLQKELVRVRNCGYALDDEECELGARCISAGVRDYTGRIVYGLSVSGPISRMSMERIREIAPVVTDAAREISKLLAGSEGAVEQ